MLPDDIVVIDNFITSIEIRSLIHEILNDINIHWIYRPAMAYSDKETTKELFKISSSYMESDGFTAMLYNIADKDLPSEHNQQLFQKFSKHIKLKIEHTLSKSIIEEYRFKINFVSPKMNINNHSGLPHVDKYVEHSTLILYLTDTDGDTFLFDTVHDVTKDKRSQTLTKHNVITQVSPKIGRAIILKNGLRYHAAGFPSKQNRVIINYNFKLED